MPVADDGADAVEQLGKIAACFALDQHGDDEIAQVGDGTRVARFISASGSRDTEIDLVECGPEFGGERIVHFVTDHLQCRGKGVSGTHRPAHQVERVRQLLFNTVQRLALARLINWYGSAAAAAASAMRISSGSAK